MLLLSYCIGAAQTRKEQALSRVQAEQLSTDLWSRSMRDLSASLEQEWASKSMVYGGHTLRLKTKRNGAEPADGRSLYISMHGGGNQAPAFNDQQWENQIRLYSPPEGLYIAPRAPTDTWNLWHEAHIDSLFDKLIRAAVVFEHVNPDKVYLMGYSAGGDGVYQLASRMSDRFAAAAMMAGHPNETKPLGLRNLGFTIHMGALDSAYRRNAIAVEWARTLDSLEKADPGAYRHRVTIHDGMGHWMKRQDSVAVPWLAKFRRNPVPNRVVWLQDDVIHHNYYWLASDTAKPGDLLIAGYSGNVVRIEYSDVPDFRIRLNDKMLDLDKPVKVIYGGRTLFNGLLKRKASVIRKTLAERQDPGLIFSSEIRIDNGKVRTSS